MKHILFGFRRIFIVSGVFLLGACSLSTISKPEALPELPPEQPFDAASLEFLNPDQEVFYNVLVAELAQLSDDHATSAQKFEAAARLGRSPELAEKAARMYLQGKDYAGAESAAQLWVELEPDNLRAYQIAAVAAFRQGDLEQALAHLDRFLERENVPAGQQWKFLNSLFQHSDYKDGLELGARLAEKYPQNTQILLMYTRLLLENDQHEKAQGILEQILQQEPGHETAVPLYVQVLLVQDKREQATAWLKQMLARYPGEDRWREHYAQLLMKQERNAEALAQYRRLLKNKPNELEYLYVSGMLSLRLEQSDKARRYFKRLLQNSETLDQKSTAHYFLAQTEEHAQRVEQALLHYRRIHEASRYYASAQARSVLLLNEHGRHDEALQYLRTLSVRDPETEIALRKLEAEMLIQAEKYDQALAVYDQSIETYPEDIDLLYLRGMLGEHMGDLGMLERDMRLILEIEPDDAEALNALGYTLADQTERYAEAYELIARALELQPDDYHILDSMGWVLYKLGKHEEAIDYLRRALDIRDDPEVAAHLVEVLWVSGDREAAREIWEKANRIFPGDERLSTVMKRFLE